MTVTFKCGHREIEVQADVVVPPRCPECGERVVVRVSKATPRFKGACKGPLVKA
jgi:hypothetical protein